MGHATEDFTQEYYVMEDEEDVMDMAMDIEKIASKLIRDISVKEPISETEVIDLFSDEYLLEILPESAYNR